MVHARRQKAMLCASFVAWIWPLGLLAALLWFQRWYLLDDWRETAIRIAFFVGLIVTPVSAVVAVVLARRVRRDGGAGPQLRLARFLALGILVLLGLAAVAMAIFLDEIQT